MLQWTLYIHISHTNALHLNIMTHLDAYTLHIYKISHGCDITMHELFDRKLMHRMSHAVSDLCLFQLLEEQYKQGMVV